MKLQKKRIDIQVELIDLQERKLPLLDESATPMMRQYTKEHTKKWSKTIDETDGFIFVTPEYNHSFSPVLKNAIDYLWHEWHYKPVAFISYGSMAGGARAVEHLRGVCGEVKLFDLRDQLLFPNYWEHLDETGNYQFSEQHEHSAHIILDDLIFWAKKMKPAREEYQKKVQ